MSLNASVQPALRLRKIKDKINLYDKIDTLMGRESERRDSRRTQSVVKQRSTESKSTRKFFGKRVGKRALMPRKSESNFDDMIQHTLAPLNKALLEDVTPPFLMVERQRLDENFGMIPASFLQRSVQSDCDELEQVGLQPWDPIIDLNKWMMQLIDQGELSTVCTALLFLGPDRLNLWQHFSETQVNSWFMAYIDLLSRFQLWITSSRIYKFLGLSSGLMDESNFSAPRHDSEVEQKVFSPSGDRRLSQGECFPCQCPPLAGEVARLNQNGTTFTIKCTACNKLIQPVLSRDCGPQEQVATNPSTPLDTVSAAGWACNRHSDRPASLSLCVLCHSTVRGLYIVCQLCNHGGHLHHIQVAFFKSLTPSFHSNGASVVVANVPQAVVIFANTETSCYFLI
ncbi:WD repeat-containing protein 24 [Cichlidogyrus casuarinus]|uniref:WD repeat-containing protein 24 n=1 Tax=Cichlidogyrus casuarinus TaxID=1844966 RepID=A0ABD2PTS7_9PLAT